jgi:hypothetical protein
LKLLELAVLLKPNYVEDWYHALLAELLQRCAHGDPTVPNLLISSPPGSEKTELIGIWFPTYIFSHDRDAHVIALSNSDSLACLASGNVLRLVQHPEFQEQWQLALDKASLSQWTIHGNDGRPSMIAVGISGGVIGHRAGVSGMRETRMKSGELDCWRLKTLVSIGTEKWGVSLPIWF